MPAKVKGLEQEVKALMLDYESVQANDLTKFATSFAKIYLEINQAYLEIAETIAKLIQNGARGTKLEDFFHDPSVRKSAQGLALAVRQARLESERYHAIVRRLLILKQKASSLLPKAQDLGRSIPKLQRVAQATSELIAALADMTEHEEGSTPLRPDDPKLN